MFYRYIIEYKKSADNYVLKEKNGQYKIISFNNNFINYQGDYLNGKKMV